MKKIFSEAESDHLNRLLTETEKRFDIQVVLAVIKRSDSYSEIPWKAFALGTSLAGLMLFLFSLFFPVWATPFLVLVTIGGMLASGLLFALTAVFIPAWARLFLTDHRAGAEVKQYAESVFLSHEVYATSKRNGILLLISLFERKVFLLPDKRIREKFGDKDIGQVIEPMKQCLADRDLKKAFELGLGQIEKLLESSGVSEASYRSNELSNQIIEEEGI